MSVITNLLQDLWNARQAAAQLAADIERLIPADLIERREHLAGQVKCLEGEIKSKTKYIPEAQAHTLVGERLQLVWAVRKSWDDSELQALATRHGIPPTELDACKVGKGGWSIRERGCK